MNFIDAGSRKFQRHHSLFAPNSKVLKSKSKPLPVPGGERKKNPDSEAFDRPPVFVWDQPPITDTLLTLIARKVGCRFLTLLRLPPFSYKSVRIVPTTKEAHSFRTSLKVQRVDFPLTCCSLCLKVCSRFQNSEPKGDNPIGFRAAERPPEALLFARAIGIPFLQNPSPA
jgi:hypothetical protein